MQTVTQLIKIGQRFGRWTVIDDDATAGNDRHLMVSCRCDCGVVRHILKRSLLDGRSHSCGCLRSEIMSATNKRIRTTHGMSSTPEYAAWLGMIRRCTDKCFKNYADYGGRGITVHLDWFGEAGLCLFLKHVGKRPNKLYSLDRIDNNGNYEPSNVRWATRSVQLQNRRKQGQLKDFSDEELLSEIKRRGLLVAPSLGHDYATA